MRLGVIAPLKLPQKTIVLYILYLQLEAHGQLVVQLKLELTRQSELHSVQSRAWSEQHEARLFAVVKRYLAAIYILYLPSTICMHVQLILFFCNSAPIVFNTTVIHPVSF